jgi:hypothetical protein
MRPCVLGWLSAIFLSVHCIPTSAQASIRGIGGGAGGIRASASTSFRPAAGVTRSVTVAAGRYHTPAVLPGYAPGLGAPGAAIRTTRRIERRIARRTAAGFVYYVGAPLTGVPASGCVMVMWEGMAVYDCEGVLYQLENGQYYPIEGA